jgi:hypothetical protein
MQMTIPDHGASPVSFCTIVTRSLDNLAMPPHSLSPEISGQSGRRV